MSRNLSTLPLGIRPSRLSAVSRIIRETRQAVIERIYDPILDEGWGINCLVFDRIRCAIKQAAMGRYADWLQVIEPNLHFVFTVDGFPLRFYRGKRERRVPVGQMHMNYPEVVAHQLTVLDILDPTYANEKRLYRILYETDRTTLLVARVFLVEVDSSGNVTNAWEIDQGSDDGVLPISAGERPVELPPAPVAVIDEILEAEEAELRLEEMGGA